MSLSTNSLSLLGLMLIAAPNCAHKNSKHSPPHHYITAPKPPQPISPNTSTYAEIKQFLNDWILSQANGDINFYEDKYSLSFDGLLWKRVLQKKGIPENVNRPVLIHYDYLDWIREYREQFSQAASIPLTIRASSNPDVLQADSGEFFVKFPEVRCAGQMRERGIKHLEIRREEDGYLRIFHERTTGVVTVQDCQQAINELYGLDATKAIMMPARQRSQFQPAITRVNTDISPESIAALQLSLDISPETLGEYDIASAIAVEVELSRTPQAKRSPHIVGFPTEELFRRQGVLLVPKIDKTASVSRSVWNHVVEMVRLRRQVSQETHDFNGLNVALYTAFDCERHEAEISEPDVVNRIRKSAMKFVQTNANSYVWTTELFNAQGEKNTKASSIFESKAADLAKLVDSIGIEHQANGLMELTLKKPVPIRSADDSMRQLVMIRQSLVNKLNQEKLRDSKKYQDITEDDIKFDKIAFFSHGMPYGLSTAVHNRNESLAYKTYPSGAIEIVGCGTSFRDSIHINSRTDGVYGDDSRDVYVGDGRGPSNLVSFALMLSRIVVRNADVLLYACSTSRGVEVSGKASYRQFSGGYSDLPRFLRTLAPSVVGRNSFANLLGKTMRRFGVKDVSVYGHLTPKHVTLNKDGTISGFDACLYKIIQPGIRRLLLEESLLARQDASSECLVNGGVHVFYAMYDSTLIRNYTRVLKELNEAEISDILRKAKVDESRIRQLAPKFSEAVISPGKLSVGLRRSLWAHFSQCVWDNDERTTCQNRDMGLLMFARLLDAKHEIEREFNRWFDKNKKREALDAAVDKQLLEKLIENAIQGGPST